MALAPNTAPYSVPGLQVPGDYHPPAPQASASRPSSLDDYFDDPLLQSYLNFGRHAVGSLSQPAGINPTLLDAINRLKGIGTKGPTVDTSFLREFADTVHKRQGELNTPGWTPSQQDLLRTNISDPLTAQRDARRQQTAERLAARGLGPGSGVYEQAMMDVDRDYEQTRATGERELGTNMMAQDEARRNQATDLGQALAQLSLATEGLGVQAGLGSQGQALGAANALAGIGGDLQNEPLQRMLAAFGIYGNLADLPFKANANAIASLGAINGTKVPEANDNSNLIALLTGVGRTGEDVYNNTQNDQSGFWGQFGSFLPSLIDVFTNYFKNHGSVPGGVTPDPRGV